MSKKKWSKKFSPEKRKAYVEEKVNELRDVLEEGVRNFSYTPEEYKALLEMQALMPTYSFNNILVAKRQLYYATFLAPASRWKSLGRYIKKGEKAIRIFKPRFVKKTVDELVDGELVDVEKEELIGFITVPVFDVSQTQGDPLPLDRIRDRRLKGRSKEAEEIIELVHKVADCPITYGDTDVANGLYLVDEHRIIISDSISVNQQAKTLVHEYVHSQVHRKDRRSNTTSEEREIVAEGVAFVVCSFFGLDTSDYSFHYVKGWQKEEGALLKYGNIISNESKRIISLFLDQMDVDESEEEVEITA